MDNEILDHSSYTVTVANLKLTRFRFFRCSRKHKRIESYNHRYHTLRRVFRHFYQYHCHCKSSETANPMTILASMTQIQPQPKLDLSKSLPVILLLSCFKELYNVTNFMLKSETNLKMNTVTIVAAFIGAALAWCPPCGPGCCL